MSHRTKMMSAARSLRQNLRVDVGVEGPYQWGTIASVSSGSPSTVGVYLDTASGQAGSPVAITGIPYLNGYYPTVGDVVLVARMSGAARTQRVVLGPLGTGLQGINQAGAIQGINTIEVQGSSAQFLFASRDGAAPTAWLWYATGGLARLWNNFLNADVMQVDENGIVTLRDALNIPPSAGGSLATGNYGTVPVKFVDATVGGGVGAASGGVTSYTISSLPTGFRNLEFEVTIGCESGVEEIGIRFNGDTGNNYSMQTIWGNTNVSGALSGGEIQRVNVSYIQVGYSGSAMTVPSIMVIDVHEYNSAVHKTCMSQHFQLTNDGTVAAGNQNLGLCGGEWKSNSAITSISFLTSSTHNMDGRIVGVGKP